MRVLMAVALMLGSVNSLNLTTAHAGDTCERSVGLWSRALEEWATSALVPSGRHGRVMALPSTKGYYVTERYDSNFLSPPPPPSHILAEQGHAPQPLARPPSPAAYIPQAGGHLSAQEGIPLHGIQMPSQSLHMPHGYKEWEGNPTAQGGGKIVNRPPKPYKDKFKPSYPAPAQPASIDRVDEPTRKQVSETDLYLLSAIEKLVYRVDLMEKRLRKMEEGVHYLLVGVDSKPEPCPENYTRVGSGCYEWSEVALDWKGASLACRKRRAALLEVTDDAQKDSLFSKLLSDRKLRGSDFWTGGLNPGLLWIWSQSARPVESNATGVGPVTGDGRCLALVGDAARARYVLRGLDCAQPLRYICQAPAERQLANEIERAARLLRESAGVSHRSRALLPTPDAAAD